MRLTYRGDQAQLISEMATQVNMSPTDMVYKIMSRFGSQFLNETIDANTAQERVDEGNTRS